MSIYYEAVLGNLQCESSLLAERAQTSLWSPYSVIGVFSTWFAQLLWPGTQCNANSIGSSSGYTPREERLDSSRLEIDLIDRFGF